MGDFTPGANLEPWQRVVILGFIERVRRLPTNEERLEAMRQFFANAPTIVAEAKHAVEPS